VPALFGPWGLATPNLDTSCIPLTAINFDASISLVTWAATTMTLDTPGFDLRTRYGIGDLFEVQSGTNNGYRGRVTGVTASVLTFVQAAGGAGATVAAGEAAVLHNSSNLNDERNNDNGVLVHRESGTVTSPEEPRVVAMFGGNLEEGGAYDLAQLALRDGITLPAGFSAFGPDGVTAWVRVRFQVYTQAGVSNYHASTPANNEVELTLVVIGPDGTEYTETRVVTSADADYEPITVDGTALAGLGNPGENWRAVLKMEPTQWDGGAAYPTAYYFFAQVAGIEADLSG
jgi:hypothetical protein